MGFLKLLGYFHPMHRVKAVVFMHNQGRTQEPCRNGFLIVKRLVCMGKSPLRTPVNQADRFSGLPIYRSVFIENGNA
jgi:hypothetical protein